MVGPRRARLNLASGPHALDGWVNVDQVSLWPRPPDVIADVYHLPFPDNTFNQAYCGHLLEHLEWATLPVFGAELRRVLDGELMVVGPALDLAIQTNQPQWLLDDIVEDPDRDATGMAHAWTPTVENTMQAVTLLGFTPTRVDVADVHRPDWPNTVTAGWQVAVRAHTPSMEAACW